MSACRRARKAYACASAAQGEAGVDEARSGALVDLGAADLNRIAGLQFREPVQGVVERHVLEPDLDLAFATAFRLHARRRSEEHKSELQSLMRNSYAVFCLKKKKNT